jgi:aarF domain-containing kinase
MRSISFYSLAVPKYILYRYHLWNNSPEEIWDKLHNITSRQALEKIYKLEGFYIKCGQLIACNVGNGFPEIWQETMSVLQDKCPPKDFSIILDIVSNELDIDSVFESIEQTPIGSASIGQVHRAKLKDGRDAVIKVCYPNVERLLRGDVRTVKAFAQIAQPVYVRSIEEIEIQFQTEFDYRVEAKNLDIVRKNLEQEGLAGKNKACILPKPFLEYCTKHVLVMEELKGEKLVDTLREDVRKVAEYLGLSVEELVEQQYVKREQCRELGIVYKGPTVREFENIITYMTLKMKLHNYLITLYNWTLGVIASIPVIPYHDQKEIPLNHAKLVDDLIYVHGHEVLIDGIFNSDPHPGNIYLCRSRNTPGLVQLGLIDYGQVKTISKETRHLFAKLVIALGSDNRDDIVSIMKEAGFKSKHMDPEVIYLCAKLYFDDDNEQILNGKHIMLFLEELQGLDPITQLPFEFIAIGRTSVMLRGLAHALYQSRSVATIWKPIAQRVLDEDI